ncbi:MAG: rod shape-determining protein MreC [Ruminococcaceae bacterium]|nr:rod shape-determining protein MreC [Oscillospiraceae bacterium]
MRFFFRSRQFKIILIVFIIIVALSSVFGIIGGSIAPQANIAGTIAAPFQQLATNISNAFSDFFKAYNDGNKLLLENSELKAQLNEMNEKLAEYDAATAENEFYKDYLGIKENNPDFTFSDATVISRDSQDPYGGFVINCGSLNDISLYDPVITDAGLVGYISEVGLTTSKVTTILSPEITIGALDNRSTDSGIVSGNLELAGKKFCKFYNLSRSCNVAIGDYVVTSGEGIFPDGLLIGTIENIGSDPYNTSIYADIKPFTDFYELRNVMIITEFDGQLSPEEREK